MSPLPNLALLPDTASRHRLGSRADFPRKEGRNKGKVPQVPREALAETSAMLERKEEHREGLEFRFS